MFSELEVFFGPAAAELLAAAGVCTVVRVPEGMGCGMAGSSFIMGP
jgi:hypothetical protein